MKRTILLLCFGLSLSGLATPVASGKLVLPKTLTAKAKGIRTIFISIQDAKSASPMPCAAQKFTLDRDPEAELLSFTLEPASLTMMGCSEIPESMNLKAKLDKDGNAGRDSAGDIVGLAKAVKKGGKDLKIVLDKLVE